MALPGDLTSALVLRTEELHTLYSRDPEALALLRRAQGTVHICAMINARACAGQTIRLYRRVSPKATTVPRGTRQVGKAVKKSLASGVMSVKAQSFVDSGADVVEVMDHPIIDLIHNPNPLFPGSMLEVASFYFGGITGNFMSVVTDERGFKMQWPGYPQYTRIVLDKDTGVVGYYFGRDSTDMVAIDPAQVIHYRNGVSRHTPWMGESELAGVLPEADMISASTMHDIAFAKNGMRPDSMIKVTGAAQKLNADQLRDIYKNLSQWRAGGSREGMPFVGQDMDWIPLSFNPKDLRTVEQLKEYRKLIHFAYGVPESMVDSNASTYAGSLVADAQHGRVIRQKLVDNAAQKTAYMMPMFGLDPNDYCLTYDNPVPKDEQADATRLSGLSAQGVMTINEVRAEMGLEKINDPNADRLLIAGRPLAEDLAGGFGGGFGGGLGGFTVPPSLAPKPDTPDDEPPAPPAPAPEPEPEPDDEPEGKAIDPAPRVTLSAHALESEGERFKAGECPSCKATGDDFTPGIVRDLFARYGDDFQAELNAILDEAQADAMRAYYDGEIPDMSINRPRVEEALTEAIGRVASDAIREEMLFAQAADDMFDVVNERALEFSRRYSIQLADDILGTTADIASAAVQRGIRDGLSIDEIAKAMEGVPAYRAEMIAITETSRAANSARFELAPSLGAKASRWITSPGHSVAHGVLASRSPLPVGEPYAKAGERIDTETFKTDIFHPPARPNCRCTLIFIYEGMAQ